MWIATIDFTKAFESITHKSVWKVLNSCGVNHEYISQLKKIYKDQKTSVQTDVESNMFEIKKGDPVKLAVQHSSTEFTERSHPALTKEKRNGTLLERLGPRLLHKPETRRRRATVRNIQRTASKNDVRIQGKY